MATIKSFTDINQSKKLAEILPLDSADGFWEYHHEWRSEGDEWEGYEDYPRAEPYFEYTREENEWKEDKSDVPCWSLAALLEIIPRNLKIVLAVNDYWDGNAVKYKYAIGSVEHNNYDCYADNHVDACYELIIKLHEQNLL